MQSTKMPTKESAQAAAPPAGMRIYAIGDIHGRADLLHELALRIEGDLSSAPERVLTIFLGDYVDRGPDSASVIERLSLGDFPTPFCALRGNHEDMLLQFLDDAQVLDDWRNVGGLETLHSYGVDVGCVMRGRGYETAKEELWRRMPERHRRFIEETSLCSTFGDYFFCHAGVKPGVPLQSQRADDLLWIRKEFLDFRGSWEKVIVHGHTPVSAPEIHANRINIDTGAFATSVLTSLVLEEGSRRLLFAGEPPRSCRGENAPIIRAAPAEIEGTCADIDAIVSRILSMNKIGV